MLIKSTERPRITSSIKWLSRIFQKKCFTLKIENFILYIIVVKIQNFLLKNCQYIVKPYLDIRHSKFQVDIFVFGKHIAQKPNLLLT